MKCSATAFLAVSEDFILTDAELLPALQRPTLPPTHWEARVAPHLELRSSISNPSEKRWILEELGLEVPPFPPSPPVPVQRAQLRSWCHGLWFCGSALFPRVTGLWLALRGPTSFFPCLRSKRSQGCGWKKNNTFQFFCSPLLAGDLLKISVGLGFFFISTDLFLFLFSPLDSLLPWKVVAG